MLEQVRHLYGRDRGFGALVAVLDAGALYGLLQRVGCDHAESHRHLVLHGNGRYALGGFLRHEVEVGRLAFYDRAPADYGGASFSQTKGIS